MKDVFVNPEIKVKNEILEKPLRHHNPFSSYIYKPDRIKFESKHEKEKVMLFLRRHVVTNVPWIFLAVLMAFAPLALSNFPIIAFLPPNFRFIAVLAWYLLTFAFVLENFLIWYFNVSIVTNKRIVDIDFVSLLYKDVADTEINRIQDVSYRMGGAVRAIFNYGDVYAQTASEVPNFDFLAVPNPDRVVRVIQRLMERTPNT